MGTLRTVRSFTELLARQQSDKLDESAKKFVSLIVAGAQNMERIIQGMLRYAQAGEEPIAKEAVAMDAVLAGAFRFGVAHLREVSGNH